MWDATTPRWKRLGFALLAIGVVFLSAEVTARLDDLVRNGIPLTAAPDFTNDLELRDSLGLRGRPNGHFERWHLNSAGFRSPESTLVRREGCTRVMILGSSETFGVEGTSPGKEFPAQASDSLNEHGCYQVMNAAIVGIGLRGMIHLWDSWASRFQPDVVVVLANPMFYLGNSAPTFPAPFAGPEKTAPLRWWTPRALMKAHDVVHYPAFIQRRRVQRQLAALTEGRPDDWFFRSPPQDRLEQYEKDLDSLVTSIAAHGAAPVLAAYPMIFGNVLSSSDSALLSAWRQYSPRAMPDAMLAFERESSASVKRVGERHNVAVIDLPRLMSGNHAWFQDFVHYTDAGAAVVAREVTRAVVAVGQAKSPGS